jgi:putative ABC transport system permease protein
MHITRQFFSILLMNLSGASQRTAPVLTIIFGVTCAVGVLVSMLAMGTGARRQELSNIGPDNATLITPGARFRQSNIPRDAVAAITSLPGIRKGAQGEPIVVFESTVPIEGRRRTTGIRIFFPLVGISSTLTEYLPQLRITDGRLFRPGLNELIASEPCVRQFNGFEIGDRRPIHGTGWTIVGHFRQDEAQQCVVYADVDNIMSAFNRNTYGAVSVRLESAAGFPAFRDAVSANPALKLEARRESEVAEEGFKELNAILDFVSYFVGIIMAIGATLGAVNSLYTIVDSRGSELATLRAIGFNSGAVVLAILAESILWALPGALLGGGLAWTFFNGLSASPFGFSFQLAVTPSLVALGVLWALGMGLLGGLLPALRAARTPVAAALRAT